MNKAEILADIATYEARLKNPGRLSPQQLDLYKKSLDAARKALEKITGQNNQQTHYTAPAAQPHYTHQVPPERGHTSRHDPIVEPTTTARRREMPPPVHVQIPPADPLQSPPNRGVGGSEALRPIVVNITAASGPRQIQILWADKDPETITEGQALSRFKSSLRDLANSTLYRQQRYSQLHTYDTYTRATGYYAALATFWPHPPTADQLDLSRSATTRHLFGIISTEYDHLQQQQQSTAT
jgi:hypothetical protein